MTRNRGQETRDSPRAIRVTGLLRVLVAENREPRNTPKTRKKGITAQGFASVCSICSVVDQETGDSPRAIRVASIHKRVEAPFYGPTRRCWSDPSTDAESWRAWLNCPTAGPGWLTGLNDAALGTHFRPGIHGMRGVRMVARRTAWRGCRLANGSLAP